MRWGDMAVVTCRFSGSPDHEEQSPAGALPALLKQLAVGVKSMLQEITEAFKWARCEVDSITFLKPAILRASPFWMAPDTVINLCQ